MFTRRFDAALEAMASCKRALPDLATLYDADSPERAAVERAMEAIAEAERLVFGKRDAGNVRAS